MAQCTRPLLPPAPPIFLEFLVIVLLMGVAVEAQSSPSTTVNATFTGPAPSVATAAASGYSSCTCREYTPLGGGALEVHCSCRGEGPVTLQRDVHSLTVTEPKQQILLGSTLRSHASTLKDLFVAEASELQAIAEDAFSALHELRSIDISEAPQLTKLPDALLEGVSPGFRTLRVVRTGLMSVPRMQSPPHMVLHMIDLESNRIGSLPSSTLCVRAELVILSYNAIQTVEDWAFNGSHIARLSLRGNRALTALGEDAFTGLHNLRDLDLSDTSITQLPTRGLGSLEVLRLRDTTSLTTIPSVYNFKHLREAWMTYSFHCCAFSFPERHDPERHALHRKFEEAARQRCRHGSPEATPGARTARRRRRRGAADDAGQGEEADEGGSWGDYPADGPGGASRDHDEDSAPYASEDNSESDEGDDDGEDSWHDELQGAGAASDGQSGEDNEDDEGGGVFHHTTLRPRRRHHAVCGNLTRRPAVRCRPAPDALNPCEDIMGFGWLRACAWLVAAFAVLGNAAVLLGLLAAPRALSPPKFLMCNLAFADLCMGLYLLLLVGADARSHQVYFNFAFQWQHGAGCRAAGFLTVFASQLSVFTLAVLTLERWLAITYALYLNKRLKLRAAAYVMAAGWVYALAMATLPLVGVSSYATTSICLPMDTSQAGDVAYLVALLLANTLAFGVVCVCYLRIYLSLGSDTRRAGGGGGCGGEGGADGACSRRRRGELTVAKRMALLVFTDFACWAPIAFFALTAVAGYPLIDVTRSKILLVFFYPLNSCANPYLYALLTKQYRRDVVALLVRHGLCSRATQKYKNAYSMPTNQSHPQQTGRGGETSATGAASGAPQGNENEEATV